jgi:hypothetical protein
MDGIYTMSGHLPLIRPLRPNPAGVSARRAAAIGEGGCLASLGKLMPGWQQRIVRCFCFHSRGE